MNLNEVEKHVKFDLIFQLLLYIAIGLCLFLSLIVILATPAKAETTSVNLTSNGVSAGQNCINHPLNAFCTSQMVQGSSSNACGNGDAKCSMYMAYGTENNVYSLNFVVNTSFHANSKVTINLKGPYFANATYGCSTNVGTANNSGCRAIRTSSTSMNINFTTNSNPLTYADFDVYISSGNGFNPNKFFNITSVILYETPIEDSSGSSSFDDSGIINNANQNTSDIIQNADENAHQTQNVITDVGANIIKELANRCNNLLSPNLITNGLWTEADGNTLVDKSHNTTINSVSVDTGRINFTTTEEWWGIANTDYIAIDDQMTFHLIFDTNIYNLMTDVFFYDSNFNYINYTQRWNTSDFTFTSPLRAKYLRVGWSSNQYGSFYISNLRLNTNGGPFCAYGSTTSKMDEIGGILGGLSGKIDEQKDIQQDTYDYLTDNTQPTANSSEISNVLGLVSVNDPLIYLTTLPITLLNKINVALNSNQCSDFNIGAFGVMGGINFGNYTFKFPCLDIGKYIGNSLWNTIDIIVGIGLLALSIYKFYHMITNILSLGAEEKASKISHYFTPMEFLSLIIEGDVPGITIRKGVINE